MPLPPAILALCGQPDFPSRSRIFNRTMIHIVERILVLIGGCHMVGILERIRLFLVTCRRPRAPFHGWGVRGRFLGLVLLWAAMVLQLARVPVLDRSALACFAHFVGGDAGEDEKCKVNDTRSMVLVIRNPMRISRESAKFTVAKLRRHWLQSPSFPKCK